MISFEQSLALFSPVEVAPIAASELESRLAGLQRRMKAEGVKALWLDASTSLTYYLGLSADLSERVHGAMIPAEGRPLYVTPAFEAPKLRASLRLGGALLAWEEHQDPCALVAAHVARAEAPGAGLAIDPATPYRFAARLIAGMAGHARDAGPMIAAQRQIKSQAEIAIIRAAMGASWRVQRAVWQGLREGMRAEEVCQFVDAAHLRLGLSPVFVAAQFGEATAYPHGGQDSQPLRPGDMVLIDLGGKLQGYNSDITRSYVFGRATPRQRELWAAERAASDAAFAAARIGAPCESVDAAARDALEARGFGPGYAVPGLPHRTGHGLGQDLHEDPFIVKGNATPLAPGMVFSIEPMLCVYGECGVRLEDIVWMGADGPHWFCDPAQDPEAPF